MLGVKLSVVISPAHERFLELLKQRQGWGRSQAVRAGLDKLMADPVVVLLPENLNNEPDQSYTKNDTEQAS